MTDRKSLSYRGIDRVTVDWVAVGDVDEVIDETVARIKLLKLEPGKHFAGVSVKWDGEASRRFLCQVQYDYDEDDEVKQ